MPQLDNTTLSIGFKAFVPCVCGICHDVPLLLLSGMFPGRQTPLCYEFRHATSYITCAAEKKKNAYCSCFTVKWRRLLCWVTGCGWCLLLTESRSSQNYGSQVSYGASPGELQAAGWWLCAKFYFSVPIIPLFASVSSRNPGREVPPAINCFI